MTRVALVILDSLPNRWVGPADTPSLWKLIAAGGWAPAGGRAVLSAATYPNHATFATGVAPAEHGVYANDVFRDGRWEPAADVGPAVPTLFDRCSERGLTSVAVLGDQYLVGVMGASRATVHWPLGGVIPDGTERDLFRYASDAAVVDALRRIDLDSADLVVVHLNEPDTAAHWHGPDAPDALDNYRRTDAALAEVIAMLEPRWDDTVVFVVSDHDQEALDPDAPPIDVADLLATRGWSGHVHPEGTAALVVDGPELAMLRSLPDIAGAAAVGPGAAVVWGEPGRVFGPEIYRLRGSHGSPRTATQVATVSGGHPSVGAIALGLAAERPSATVWARWAHDLLGLESGG